MDRNNKKDLEKYLSPKIGGLLAGGFFILLGIFGMGVAIGNPGGIFLLCAFFAALCSFKPGTQVLTMKRFLESSEKDDTLSEILQDFNQGVSLAEDSIRFGNQYIIGRSGVVATKYDDITQVYEYVHKTNFATDSRMIKVKTIAGGERVLCRLPLQDVSKEEVFKIFLLIKSKNKSVKIGYR